MSGLVHARVLEHLERLKLKHTGERLDAVLSEAARSEPTYLDFLDRFLREEVDARQRRRIDMGLKIARFPVVKTLEEFDFKFQPSVDQRLVRELATGRYIATGENVLLLGPPGVGKSHLAVALGRCAVETGYTVHFTTATSLLAELHSSHIKGTLSALLLMYSKPKLLIVDELGYLPLERQSANLFFQLVSRRYERGSMLITTNQAVTQWGHVFGDEVIAAAILDRLLHHCHTIFIQGESYRMKQRRKAGLRIPTSPQATG
jgi:DNA replication protein DnaC